MTNGRTRLLMASFSLVLVFTTASGGLAAAASPANIETGGMVPSAARGLGDSEPARPRASSFCSLGWCYYFVSMQVLGATTTGASVHLSQAQPKVGAADRYSGAMITVSSANGRQAIELGWWVSKSVFHDSLPHLAFNTVVDTVPSCLNGCGFVAVSKTVRGGSTVATSRQGVYTIKLGKNRWNLVYNGSIIGYYPTSIWAGRLNRSFFESAFGVVASSSATTPHSQMGNGQLGTNSRSAKAAGFKLIGSVGTPRYSYFSLDAPSKYKVGFFKPGCKAACSMNFGGPGF